jgi:hypothetical protein
MKTLNFLDTSLEELAGSARRVRDKRYSSGYPHTSDGLYGKLRAQYMAKLPILMEWDYSIGFPYFAKLTGELRNMIWEFALPGERVIRVSSQNTTQQILSSGQPVPPCPNGCSCLVHYFEVALSAKPDVDVALLRTCREARSIALKYYQQVSCHPFRLSSPIYYCPDTDKISFADPYTLLVFVWGRQPGCLEAIKQLALRDIYIESVPDSPHTYAPSSPLTNTAISLNIGALDSCEIIGFACMRLKTVKNIILNRSMSAGFGKQAALDASCWKEQAQAQQGIDSYIAKWMQCSDTYQYDNQLDDADSPLDCSDWVVPKVKAFLAKYTVGRPLSFSINKNLVCEQTALWTREEVEKLW